MIKTDIVGPLKNIKGGCAAICHRLHHLLRLEFCKRLMGDSVDTVCSGVCGKCRCCLILFYILLIFLFASVALLLAPPATVFT